MRIRYALSLVALLCVSASSAVGCAAPVEEEEVDADDAAILGEPSFAFRVMLPDLHGYGDADPKGELALEVSASAGGFFGMGADRQTTVGPGIYVGDELYAFNGEFRIGADLTLYMQIVPSNEEPELYCCTGSRYPQKEGGVWRGKRARVMDWDQSGYYAVGKIVGLSPSDIHHGAKLKPSNIVLNDDLEFSYTRRIMRGDRYIAIEASEPPELHTGDPPELLADPDAAAEFNATR